ncbi:hypothetical protein TCSYLVIO_003634 [Trypanosoma cruzi]|nr:hypothetical protein TCSYLVIO_003634 [Trypanosoma cruzi]
MERGITIGIDCFSPASTAECGPRRKQPQPHRRATESMPPLSRVVSRRRQRQAEEAADRDKQQQQRHCRGSEAGRPSGLSPNPRAPPPHQRHQGPWVPWLWHNRRHTIGGKIAVARKIALLQSLLRRTRGVAGRDHPVACQGIWRDCFSSGDGFFWGAAESTSFVWVPRPGSMLSATGTDAPS